jgi:hypothetical protein
MKRAAPWLMVLSSAALLYCGGAPGTPLRSGSVTGNFNGTMFTAVNGFAASRSNGNIIIMGTGRLNCASIDATEPPDGMNGQITPRSLDAGTYSNVSVRVMKNDGNWEAFGSGTGSLTITAEDSTHVAGTITYMDTINSRVAALNGTFDVSRCP